MLNVFAAVREAQTAYINHLNGGGERVAVVTTRSGDDSTGWTYASDLGKCPLANAQKAHGVAPKIPELLLENDPHGLWRTTVGNRLAEIIQEAVLWYYAPEAGRSIIAYCESNLRDEIRKVRGRADIVLIGEGEINVIDVKVRNVDSPLYQFKFEDFFQLGSYWRILTQNHTQPNQGRMHILCIPNIDIWNLYTLHPDGDGFIVRDQNGRDWMDPRNTPAMLRWETLDAEIRRQMDYRMGFPNVPLPFHDPVQQKDVGGWQCFAWDGGKKPKFYKGRKKDGSDQHAEPGYIRARCPYSCHFDSADQVVEVTIDADENMISLFPVGF